MILIETNPSAGVRRRGPTLNLEGYIKWEFDKDIMVAELVTCRIQHHERAFTRAHSTPTTGFLLHLVVALLLVSLSGAYVGVYNLAWSVTS